jgi:predicted nucleic acid-binding protein
VIAYFDTSALIPLLIAEPGSEVATTIWNGASRVVSTRLAYAEGRAALAQAHRMNRLTPRQLRAAVKGLHARYEELNLVELDDDLVRRAGDLAERHALRGYDAVHLAAADRIRDPELVVVAGDEALLAAARVEGMATARVA